MAGFEASFAEQELSLALITEDAAAARYRLSRLARLESYCSPNLTPGGQFAALYAKDILTAFDRQVEGDFTVQSTS